MQVLTPPAPAPDFTLPALGGGAIHLAAALTGGPVGLLFFEADCPTCEFVLPLWRRLVDGTPTAAGRLLAVAQNTAEQARALCDRLGAGVPVAVDAEPFPVSRAYGLMTVPTLFLVEANGTLGLTSEGFARADWETGAAGRRRWGGPPVRLYDSGLPAGLRRAAAALSGRARGDRNAGGCHADATAVPLGLAHPSIPLSPSTPPPSPSSPGASKCRSTAANPPPCAGGPGWTTCSSMIPIS